MDVYAGARGGLILFLVVGAPYDYSHMVGIFYPATGTKAVGNRRTSDWPLQDRTLAVDWPT